MKELQKSKKLLFQEALFLKVFIMSRPKIG